MGRNLKFLEDEIRGIAVGNAKLCFLVVEIDQGAIQDIIVIDRDGPVIRPAECQIMEPKI